MAKKSKTQRAKASAARAAKKEAQAAEAAAENVKETAETVAEAPKKKLFGKTEASSASADKQASKALEKSEKASKSVSKDKKPAKQRFQFLKDVRAELKRVTWPSRQDVVRWSVVVVVALIFFGVYVAILDNAIITPLLIAISGLGA